MQKSLHIDPAKCTGCLQCEMACSYEHTGAINPSKSRIKVFNFGCKVCTIACPFGTVNYMADVGKVQKCDLCGGDPKCVTACPTAAITYVDADWTGLDRMRAWAAKSNTAAVAA